jgi:lactoylglutathione lyase
MLREIFHFSFTVSDLEESIRWYRDVLGLEFVHRQRQDNDYTRKLVAMPDAVLEIAQFRVPAVPPAMSTHVLELVQYVRPAGEPVDLKTNNTGVAHLAFVVDEIKTEFDRLSSAGVEFRNPPVEIMEGVNRGGYSCYLSDPDGITLELIQLSPKRQRELEAQSRPR